MNVLTVCFDLQTDFRNSFPTKFTLLCCSLVFCFFLLAFFFIVFYISFFPSFYVFLWIDVVWRCGMGFFSLSSVTATLHWKCYFPFFYAALFAGHYRTSEVNRARLAAGIFKIWLYACVLWFRTCVCTCSYTNSLSKTHVSWCSPLYSAFRMTKLCLCI